MAVQGGSLTNYSMHPLALVGYVSPPDLTIPIRGDIFCGSNYPLFSPGIAVENIPTLARLERVIGMWEGAHGLTISN